MMPNEFSPEGDSELSPMELNGAAQNEMFEVWQRSGFSEEQAFDLVKVCVAASFGAVFKL